MRQLLDSLSREQRRNQELLASLVFAQRSFTNLSRFLELVPLGAARLVGAESALLVVFREDGRLWREQLHASPWDCCGDLLRQLGSAADAYLQLQAAAKGTKLEGDPSRRIFEALALAMSRLGRSSADTQAALLAKADAINALMLRLCMLRTTAPPSMRLPQHLDTAFAVLEMCQMVRADCPSRRGRVGRARWARRARTLRVSA